MSLLLHVFLLGFAECDTGLGRDIGEEDEWVAEVVEASFDLLILFNVFCDLLAPLCEEGVVSLNI